MVGIRSTITNRFKPFFQNQKQNQMKKLVLAAAIIAAFTGCNHDPQSTKIEGNGIRVEFLFEHDGVKMYRFYDGGHCHYFTNRGETSTTQTEGKTTYEETIN